MTSIINEPPAPPLPVVCDFFFEQTGPPGTVTYDGETYPYPPLPSDKGSDYRYALGTTPAFLAVEFFAIEHEYEGKVQPYVVPPPGVSILEYYWDFGDGFFGYGPIVTHTYEVADPNTSISLTVLDSLDREFSTSKQLSLVIVDFGYVGGYTIRGRNTETTPKRQTAETRDTSLTQESNPKFIWLKHGSKRVREESDSSLAVDRATLRTHFYRKTTDTSDTTDVVTRTRRLRRNTTDTSLTTIVSKQNVHRHGVTTDKSKAVDQAKSRYFKPFQALLKLATKFTP